MRSSHIKGRDGLIIGDKWNGGYYFCLELLPRLRTHYCNLVHQNGKITSHKYRKKKQRMAGATHNDCDRSQT